MEQPLIPNLEDRLLYLVEHNRKQRRPDINQEWCRKADFVQLILGGLIDKQQAANEAGVKIGTIYGWIREYKITRGQGYRQYGDDFFYGLLNASWGKSEFKKHYGTTPDCVYHTIMGRRAARA